MKILYLVHDLSDATVHKRAIMLVKGGAEVVVAGYRRSENIVADIHGCDVYDFGRTYNSGFGRRILSVLKLVITINKYKGIFTNCDAVIARNLEMLAIGVRGKVLYNDKCPLVYESLDIHRLLLNKGIIGKTLRSLEGWLSGYAYNIWTSSPAFISEYFGKLSKVKCPIKLIENKVFYPNEEVLKEKNNTNLVAGKPWKIGWFGAIRCRKSLDILQTLVQQSNGEIEVIIRGRPAYDQFDNFQAIIDKTEGLYFYGSYKNPKDLNEIYNEVHFTWAIDMFEEGLNSSWLLPNRLYEGGLFGSIPIAIESVHTGEFIKTLGVGIIIKEASPKALQEVFDALTSEKYLRLKRLAKMIPQDKWLCSLNECKLLVDGIKRHD